MKNKNMKTLRISVLTCCALLAMFLTSAYGNHRTGEFALPELIVAGDFNNDGNLDLAVNVTGFDNVAIFLGDGRGGFSLARHVATDTLPKGLAVGDIDRDGHLDLVTANDWGYDLNVYDGDGFGGFSDNRQLKGEGDPTRLLIKDFNNDGRLDIAVNAPSEDKILLFLGDGKGNFANPPDELEDLPKDFGIAAGDFNRDGNLDIAATTIAGRSATGSNIVILLGDGAGGFTMSWENRVNPDPTSVQSGDLNNDGILDLVVAGALSENKSGNFVATLLGDGTGNFSPKQTINLGAGELEGEITLGDFNEDGKLDVVYPVSGTQSATKSTTILVFFGDGSGGLVAGPVLTVGQEPHTVITADVNKDGHLDLVNSNRSDATISVLLGDGAGNFAAPTFFSVICDTCLE